ncbi:MAG: lysostaphin resistance A-like protein, partial [Bacteroidia bacterium]
MDKIPQQPSPAALFGPGFRVMLLFTLLFSCGGILNMLGYIPGLEFIQATGDDITIAQMRITNALSSLLVLMIPALVITNVFPPNRFYWLGLHQRTPVWWLVFAAIIMVAMVFVGNPIAEFTAGLITDPEIKKMDAASALYNRQIEYMPAVGDYISCLLILALLPAIAEELFFRAALLQLLVVWFRNKHIAVVFSALIFTFMHGTVTGFPAIFLGGLILGYLFMWTGSLRVSIIGHFMFNAFSITTTYMNQHSPQS